MLGVYLDAVQWRPVCRRLIEPREAVDWVSTDGDMVSLQERLVQAADKVKHVLRG